MNISWNFLDFFGEFGTNFLENPYGFEYDLILHKYAPKYWSTILEIDSNWNSAYLPSYPQIHDPVDNFSEYLPIWNYDASIWELHGFEYDISPLILSDDSKLLLNSKIARFDLNIKWLENKNLFSGSVAINDLSWGGSNIISGLSEHLPYDFLYGSDDDSDFEMYSEYFFSRNWEDQAYSLKKLGNSIFRTTTTASEEYPQAGFFREISMSRMNTVEQRPSREQKNL
jgi:hypothetical protein